MRKTTFHIDTYIAPGEAFHFARKELAKRFPEAAHDHGFPAVFRVVALFHGCVESIHIHMKDRPRGRYTHFNRNGRRATKIREMSITSPF